MSFVSDFRTTRFFRTKTKYPINTEFVTLKTLKIRLKLSNSRSIIDGFKDSIASSFVSIGNGAAPWGVVKFTMAYLMPVTYYARNEFAQSITARNNPVEDRNKMLKGV